MLAVLFQHSFQCKLCCANCATITQRPSYRLRLEIHTESGGQRFVHTIYLSYILFIVLVQQKGMYCNRDKVFINSDAPANTTAQVHHYSQKTHLKFSQRLHTKTLIPLQRTWQLKAYLQHYCKSTPTMLPTASLSLSLWRTTRRKQQQRQQQWTVVSVMRMDSILATLSQPHWSHGCEERWIMARGESSVHVLIPLRSILIWLYIDNFSPWTLCSNVLCMLECRIE